MLEKELEAKIVKYAKSKKCLCYKFSSPSTRGVPDRIIITPKGVVCFLEIKATGKKPTRLQLREIERLKQHNITADWVDNLEEAKSFIDLYTLL